MSRKGYSDRNIWGGYNHYDEHGRKIGHSEPGLFGGFNEYDSKGKKIGHTEPSFFGGYNHYDKHGRKVGHSDPSFIGGYNHYDKNGKRTGSSDPSMFGYSHYDNEGCYIATCVYGSYDCPEVWVLRRYRDYVLKTSALGRAFVKIYYAISPKLVSIFGKKEWFKTIWKRFLDHKIRILKDNGFADTAYCDKKG